MRYRRKTSLGTQFSCSNFLEQIVWGFPSLSSEHTTRLDFYHSQTNQLHHNYEAVAYQSPKVMTNGAIYANEV